MRIDFHTHGKLARELPFSPEYLEWLFSEARAAGLDALCLTEHFNTLEFDRLYDYIQINYERDGDCFIKNGLRIFPGMEIDVAEGGHMTVLGSVESILKMNHNLELYKERGKFLPIKELSDMVKEYPVLFGAAHPFRKGSCIPELSDELLSKFDFIECNGEDIAFKGPSAKKEVQKFAEKLKLPVVAGSDAHQNFQYCCVYNSFEKRCRTVTELYSEIKRGAYGIVVSKDAALRVHSATILKRVLKEVHALGGDYTSLLLRPVKEKSCSN